MSGLESEFEGKVRGHNRDATTAENAAAVQSLGFQSHGIVLRSTAGEVLWTEPDHRVDLEHLRKTIRERLGPAAPAAR